MILNHQYGVVWLKTKTFKGLPEDKNWIMQQVALVIDYSLVLDRGHDELDTNFSVRFSK